MSVQQENLVGKSKGRAICGLQVKEGERRLKKLKATLIRSRWARGRGCGGRGAGWGVRAVYDRASRGSRSKLLHGGGEVTVARGSRGGDGASDKAVGDVSDSRKIFLGVPASHFHYQGRYAGRWKKLPPWGMWDRGFSAMAVGMPKLSGITSEAHTRKGAARGASTGTSHGRGTQG